MAGVPTWVWLLGGGLALAAVAAPASASSSTSGSSSSVPANAAAVDQAWRELGMPEVWQHWGRFVARGESGFHITAELGKPGDDRSLARSEHAAAVKAYERLVSEGRWPCDQRAASQIRGSGGWYGQLEPLTAFFLRKYGPSFAQAACAPVTQIWQSPRQSTLAHMGQVRGTWNIARNKLGRDPTVLELRALYGLPSRDPREVDTPKRRSSYTAKASSAGLPSSFLDQRLPPLPGPAGVEALEGAELEGAELELLDPVMLEALAQAGRARREAVLG